MTIYFKVAKGTVAAGATKEKVGEFTVPSDERWTITDILPLVPADCKLYIHIQREEIGEIDGDIIAKDNRWIPVDWELSAGQKIEFKADNPTGSDVEVGVQLRINIEKT